MFIYHLFLKCCEPISLCVILLVAAACLRKRKVLARVCFWAPVALLMICGNGWFTGGLIRRLERQYPARTPVPPADCILILGGGTESPIPPRPTVEVDDAGDRVLYGAHLYRLRKAPWVLCTNGAGQWRPGVEDMAELLEMIGVPKDAIIKEAKALDTHQHAVYLRPLFQERGFKRILLVTSAAHMPRSMGVFKRLCPGLEFIPAPTDFRVPNALPTPWYRHLAGLVPSAGSLVGFSNAMHEYMGMVYYKLRGWMD